MSTALMGSVLAGGTKRAVPGKGIVELFFYIKCYPALICRHPRVFVYAAYMLALTHKMSLSAAVAGDAP